MSRPSALSTRLSSAAPVFTALGDATRLALVTRLCDEGPLSIARLTAGTSLTRQAVTKHLQVLSDAGLTRAAWSGRERLWRVDAKRLADVRRLLARLSDQWDAALGRLQQFVEDGEA